MKAVNLTPVEFREETEAYKVNRYVKTLKENSMVIEPTFSFRFYDPLLEEALVEVYLSFKDATTLMSMIHHPAFRGKAVKVTLGGTVLGDFFKGATGRSTEGLRNFFPIVELVYERGTLSLYYSYANTSLRTMEIYYRKLILDDSESQPLLDELERCAQWGTR